MQCEDEGKKVYQRRLLDVNRNVSLENYFFYGPYYNTFKICQWYTIITISYIRILVSYIPCSTLFFCASVKCTSRFATLFSYSEMFVKSGAGVCRLIYYHTEGLADLELRVLLYNRGLLHGSLSQYRMKSGAGVCCLVRISAAFHNQGLLHLHCSLIQNRVKSGAGVCRMIRT